MRNCIFCKMPKSEILRSVYEDRVCRIILSRYPVERGHLLIISKKHYADILSAPDSVITHTFKLAKRFGKITRTKMKCRGLDIGVNVGANGSIRHFHIHILPRYSKRLLHFAPGKNEIHRAEVNEIKHLLKM